MTDRPISLDLHLGLRDSSRMTGGESGIGAGPGTPDQTLVERFAVAMTAESGPTDRPDESRQPHYPDRSGRPEAARTPFALFAALGRGHGDDDPLPPPPSPLSKATSTENGSAIASDRPGTGTSIGSGAGIGDRANSDRSRLLDAVIEAADRILVDAGERGRREVRVELADTVLPGVTVSVYQQHGEWVADFECSDPRSYGTLAEPASSMASELADLLRTPARWRVALAVSPQTVVEAAARPFEH